MNSSKRRRPPRPDAGDVACSATLLSAEDASLSSSSGAMASRNASCADCDPSTTASTASVSSDLHKYHVACSCGGSQYAECTGGGGGTVGDRVKSERPPALPPRPPPRNATGSPSTRNNDTSTQSQRTQPNASAAGSGTPGVTNVNNLNNAGPRKYVWWCTGMGAASCLLGALLLTAALILRTRTASLHHLETIPTPVPATMLVLTGICVMSLARRRNRYSSLIKVAGGCCLVCAFTCVLVTITTTVIHMNRLQTLRECVYTRQTQTCTCFTVLLDSQNTSEDEGVKCVFEAVADCAAVHGDLYRCLRAVFGLSVAGVLVCICSAMLAYQLLSHERKKMYWEQLELRCRSLYRPAGAGQATARPHTQQPQACGECCSQCRAAAAVSWDLQHRFWASGRVGNLYSPNPGTGRRVSPWSWFPWPRNSNQRVGGSSSGDSAYGFGANSPGGYWQLGPPPPYTPHQRYLQRNGIVPPTEPGRSTHRHTLLQSHLSQQLTPHIEGCVSTLPDAHHRRVIQHHALHCDAVRCEHATRTSSSSPSNSNVMMMMMNGSSSQMMNMMMEGNTGHGANMNSAPLTGATLSGVDSRRDSEASTVHRVECHHQNNLESNRDSFAEELEDIHQHSCQKHGPRSDADIEAAILQGEENLGFQCEKQAQQRQARGGESELYFADVSSCCNVSLKAVDYCGGGLVGTIEAQADTWSGCDSDNNQNAKPSNNTARKNHKFHHSSNTSDNINKQKNNNSIPSCSNDNTDDINLPPRNHRRLRSSSPNDSPIRLQSHCDEALNQSHRGADVAGMLNPENNRHRSPETQCNGSRESSLVMCHDDSNDSLPCAMSQGFMCRSNHARSSHHFRDECRDDGCRFVSRCQHHCIDEADEAGNGCQEYLNTCRHVNRDEDIGREHLQCINNGNNQINTVCQGSGANIHGLVHCQERNSIRIKSSPNRLSMHRKNNTDTFNSVGLPVVNSHGIRNEYLIDSLINNGISQFRRSNNDILEEEVQMRRLAIEECVLGDDLSSLAQYKRANIEEALTSDGNNIVNNLLQYRMNNIDESILSDAHLMGRDDDIGFVVSQLHLRRKAIEESLNANSDPNGMFINSPQRNIGRKGLMEEAGALCNDKHSPRRKFDDGNSPLNQSNLRNNNSDISGDANNFNMPQFRRINMEDAILNSDQSITLTSPLRRKALNESNNMNNTDLNKSTSPMSRKGINDSILSNNDDQNLSISNLQRKCFEDSSIGNQIDVSLHSKGDMNAVLSDLNHFDISKGADLSNLSHFNSEFDADLGVNTEPGNRRGIINQTEPNSQHAKSHLKGEFDGNSVGVGLEGGNRRGIVDGVCLPPDLRYEPVRGFDKGIDEVDACDVAMIEGDANRQGGMHLRCCSDSNTMDSGWQSGSEKHVTD